MDQRKLMDNANTITDMAKVSILFCSIFFSHCYTIFFDGNSSILLYPFVCIYTNHLNDKTWGKNFYLLAYKRSYRLSLYLYSLNCVHNLQKKFFSLQWLKIIIIVEKELQTSYLLLMSTITILPELFLFKKLNWIGEVIKKIIISKWFVCPNNQQTIKKNFFFSNCLCLRFKNRLPFSFINLQHNDFYSK